jgi:hypothetical protein
MRVKPYTGKEVPFGRSGGALIGCLEVLVGCLEVCL